MKIHSPFPLPSTQASFAADKSSKRLLCRLPCDVFGGGTKKEEPSIAAVAVAVVEKEFGKTDTSWSRSRDHVACDAIHRAFKRFGFCNDWIWILSIEYGGIVNHAKSRNVKVQSCQVAIYRTIPNLSWATSCRLRGVSYGFELTRSVYHTVPWEYRASHPGGAMTSCTSLVSSPWYPYYLSNQTNAPNTSF